jgi:hypothetical protein
VPRAREKALGAWRRGLTLLLFPKDLAESLLAAVHTHKGLIQLALVELHLRQGAQIIIARQRHDGSGVLSRHLAVADKQQAARPKLCWTRSIHGIYRGSSARSPETTSVASGIPKGSRTACMILT